MLKLLILTFLVATIIVTFNLFFEIIMWTYLMNNFIIFIVPFEIIINRRFINIEHLIQGGPAKVYNSELLNKADTNF